MRDKGMSECVCVVCVSAVGVIASFTLFSFSQLTTIPCLLFVEEREWAGRLAEEGPLFLTFLRCATQLTEAFDVYLTGSCVAASINAVAIHCSIALPSTAIISIGSASIAPAIRISVWSEPFGFVLENQRIYANRISCLGWSTSTIYRRENLIKIFCCCWRWLLFLLHLSQRNMINSALSRCWGDDEMNALRCVLGWLSSFWHQ